MAYDYAYQEGVERDYPEAFRLLRLAAEQSEPRAMYTLGVAYAETQGTAKNINEAIRWLRLAADAGQAWSYIRLGELYVQGNAVDQDHVESARWIEQLPNRELRSRKPGWDRPIWWGAGCRRTLSRRKTGLPGRQSYERK